MFSRCIQRFNRNIPFHITDASIQRSSTNICGPNFEKVKRTFRPHIFPPLTEEFLTVPKVKFVKSPSSNFATQRRNLRTDNQPQLPKTPELIYFPHVLRWLKTKFRIKYLQKTWDPDFTEGAFIYGSTQAICRITEIIEQNQMGDLKELVTSMAKRKIEDDVTNKLTKNQKKIIRITPTDIKILVPMSVDLVQEGNTKMCKIAMRVLALKWFLQNNGIMKLVLVALQSEFSKDYTHDSNQDWIISAFDVLECTVLTETTSNVS